MNVKFPHFAFRFLPLIFLGCILVPGIVLGVEPTVRATLSDSNPRVGQPVDIQIEITDAQNITPPSSINVDGLAVSGISNYKSRRFSFGNGGETSSVQTIYSIRVVPQRAGTFTIPAIPLEVDGKKVSTKPLILTATDASTGTGRSGAGSGPGTASNDLAYAEIVVPRENVYVGEALPVELRIYIDSRVRLRSISLPDIKREGFTVQKIPQPRQQQIQKGDRFYNSFVFKTAVTPVKSGKLTLGPGSMNYVAQVPQQRRNPLGDDLADVFAQLNPQLEQLVVNSKGVELEVKPLPKQNQPASFSGAVGEFALSTEASPLKVKTGDPITLKLKVSGRGNFDLVAAPRMADQAGWRSYPPSNKFTADDDVGISGSKVFEMAVIPEEKKTKLPVVEFSYFDPLKEKYVTLTADRMSINVWGQNQPAPTAQPSLVAQPQATPAKEPGDIHYILTGPANWGKSFIPIFMKPAFWKAQGAPAVLLLAFIGFRISVRRKQDVAARQQAEWRRRKSELMKIMHDDATGLTAFYEAATQYIQIDAARTSQANPASIGPAEALAARSLDSATAEAVQALFNSHGELAYAGASAPRQKPSQDQRQKVLATLKTFENASNGNI